MAEIRVNVDDEFLEALKKKLNNPKNTEVIQDALALLNWGADAALEGRDIVSADKQRENLEKVLIPRLTQLKAQRK